MTVFIALLRAINVGGTGKLPMAEFRNACETAGLLDVETYIASGNVIFSSDKTQEQVHQLLLDILTSQFGLVSNDVILRQSHDLAETIANNPFKDAANIRPHMLHVQFLANAASDSASTYLAAYAGPERLHLAANHLYVDYVNGAGTTNLTPSKLQHMLNVTGTSRNWNTCQELLSMAMAQENPAPSTKLIQQSQRKSRLAAALKANLKRRKART